MGIKKRMCNPLAEEVAGSGDPEVRGMFIGAGRGASVIQDLDLRLEFESRVVDCETRYIMERKDLAERARVEMDEIFHDVMSRVGPRGEDLKK